ncbi:unnamed protein product [Caenorhabditis sp. 36 PRJEB53466]|nr:unnamed protein product [Caenorhabditis sp. 36 PRJEB53466]
MTSPQFATTHLTKEELLYLMTTISEKLKVLNRSQNAPRTRMIRSLEGGARRDLIFDLFLRMVRLFKVADKMVSIEGSAVNLQCLLVSAKFLATFFESTFTKLAASQLQHAFDEYHVAHGLTQCDVAVGATSRVVSDVAKRRHAHHFEVKRAIQEQKAFRESFLKSQTDFDIDFDDHEADQETQLLSIEDAVLIIQKLERKYQSISRRNYVRFVRERAAELHGQKVEIDATQAAIRIQARTRGYFARKMVREMREQELNILGMTPESYIRVRLAERQRKQLDEVEMEKVQQVEDMPSSLEACLDLLKSQFFLASSTGELPDPAKLLRLKEHTDNAFRDACFRGVVSPLAAIELHELVSQKELCRIDARQFHFDLRSFLVCTVCIPMAVATWKSGKEPGRRLLLSGLSNSGKTAWARGIARACFVTHVHISKNVVNLAKRRIYTVIKKLARQESRLLISIDRLDVLKKDPKHKGMTHRQILLRTFLSDMSATSATIIGMTKTPWTSWRRRSLSYSPYKLRSPTQLPRPDMTCQWTPLAGIWNKTGFLKYRIEFSIWRSRRADLDTEKRQSL